MAIEISFYCRNCKCGFAAYHQLYRCPICRSPYIEIDHKAMEKRAKEKAYWNDIKQKKEAKRREIMKRMNLTDNDPDCPECHGSGEHTYSGMFGCSDGECLVCFGSGHVKDRLEAIKEKRKLCGSWGSLED
jgi:hypothetical protein